jgi:hypothetical protein
MKYFFVEKICNKSRHLQITSLYTGSMGLILLRTADGQGMRLPFLWKNTNRQATQKANVKLQKSLAYRGQLYNTG